MLVEQQSKLIEIINSAISKILPEHNLVITLERPKIAAHGDVACNIAMQMARLAKRNPRELANDIVTDILANPASGELISHAEVAGPGFINIRLAASAHQAVLNVIQVQGAKFGTQAPNQKRVLVEFVSANPTGPLHVGHARQAALGDSLCRLFTSQGASVYREFYYNDAGNQIHNLAISVQARANDISPDNPEFPADGYRGQYIVDIAKDYLAGATITADNGTSITAAGDINDLDAIRKFAVAYLRREQDQDLQAFDLSFDNYYLESSLYTDGYVDKIVNQLIDNGFTYEKDQALWLRTTELDVGDDKDRVMRKSEGGYTYFVPDVAYHLVKWERGYHQAINIQGSDHHGTIARVRAGLQGLKLDIPKTYPSYILHKMVRVMRDGQEVKISKRAGSYVTLRELIDWVGRDAVRFFLIQRRADSEFTFDIDLALSHSEENPVYYIQYAHARIHSLMRQHGADLANTTANISQLTAPTEITLLQRLSEYPQTLTQAAQDLAPHQLANWLRECAADFHAWYNAERILVDNKDLSAARLLLAQSCAQVIANGLELLGVSAPDRM